MTTGQWGGGSGGGVVLGLLPTWGGGAGGAQGGGALFVGGMSGVHPTHWEKWANWGVGGPSKGPSKGAVHAGAQWVGVGKGWKGGCRGKRVKGGKVKA